MEKCIIAAVSKNGAIGKDNALLWHLKEDMRYFKATTLGHPVIMGRRTFESIGRPLPGRRNIVVSKTLQPMEGITIVPSLDEAYRKAEEYLADKGQEGGNASAPEGAPNGNTPCDRCFIIGGAQLYAEAISGADALYITAVKALAPEADKFFPLIDSKIWKLTSSSEQHTDPATGIKFTFDIWTREH